MYNSTTTHHLPTLELRHDLVQHYINVAVHNALQPLAQCTSLTPHSHSFPHTPEQRHDLVQHYVDVAVCHALQPLAQLVVDEQRDVLGGALVEADEELECLFK